MSFDLFVFEKREEIKTSLDVFAYQEEFTEYKENKDYESLDGCSDVISCWTKKMFEKFPPISGKYALPDEIAYATEDSENRITTLRIINSYTIFIGNTFYKFQCLIFNIV